MEKNMAVEGAARDAALDLLEETRADLITLGRCIAKELANRDGSTCSPRVLREMKSRGVPLQDYDGRWAGAIFRPKTEWRKTGEMVFEGSHKRPVPLWVPL